MNKIYYSLVIIFSILLWGCQVEEDVKFNTQNRTLQIKAEMLCEDSSSADESTRVSLQPGATGIKVRWEAGDIVYFVFAQEGVAIGKTEVTLTADNISNGGANAIFEFELPGAVGDKFDLYSVHGGNGFDGYDLKVPEIEQSLAGDLNGFGQNVTMYHSVVKDVNYDTNNVINLSFEHIGSLFHIELRSIEGATLSGVVEASLWSSDEIFAVQNDWDNDITYNPITGNLSATNYNNVLYFNIDATDLSANGTVDFWGWYIPSNTESWPALGLIIGTIDDEIPSANAQPARSSATDKGNAYHFYATYDGGQLLFTNAAGDDNLTTMMDNRDGTVYKTVRIGDQVWMAENLKYLPEVSGPASKSTEAPHYYVYDYDGTDVDEAIDTENYKTYGVLYNWAAAMAGSSSSDYNPSEVQGICPEGWHLPSDAEWDELAHYLMDNGYKYDGTTGGDPHRNNEIGKAMADPELWTTVSYGTGTIGNKGSNSEYNNKSGFSARPGGILSINSDFFGFSYNANFYSSSYYYHGSSSVSIRELTYGRDDFMRNGTDQEAGLSVRCVRDYPSITYALTLQSSDEEMGTVSGEGVFGKGDVIEVSAITNFGYNFVEWTGDTKFLDDPNAATSKVTMPLKEVALTAIFEKADYYDNIGSFIDNRDNTVYNTIKIGDQTWMAENLRFIEDQVSGPTSGSNADPYYYVYDYDGTDVEEAKATNNYKTYGVLYNWPAATTACPEGWHLPSDNEWVELRNYLIDNDYSYNTAASSYIAIAMAEPGLWTSTHTDGTIGKGGYPEYTNKSGFSARPGGYRFWQGEFSGITRYSYWWTSTMNSSVAPRYRYLEFHGNTLGWNSHDKGYGNSVRCVKD